MRLPDDEPPSFIGRVIGALCALVFTGLTILAIPFLIGVKSFWVWWLPLHSYNSIVFFMWVALVSGAAGVIGFRAGVFGTLDLLGHLWGTAEPLDYELRTKLWLAIAGLGGMTLLLGWLAHAP
jgi:hypothetical protein